jgi:hypothetical protein
MADVKQGDSIERDVTSTTITDFTNWTGLWAIFTAIGQTPIKSGALTMSTDKTRLQCNVPPYDGADVLPEGNIVLEIQVSFAGPPAFRRTLSQEKIKITKQGIV